MSTNDIREDVLDLTDNVIDDSIYANPSPNAIVFWTKDVDTLSGIQLRYIAGNTSDEAVNYCIKNNLFKYGDRFVNYFCKNHNDIAADYILKHYTVSGGMLGFVKESILANKNDKIVDHILANKNDEIVNRMISSKYNELLKNENDRIVEQILLPNITLIKNNDLFYRFSTNANNIAVDYFILNNMYDLLMYKNKNPKIFHYLKDTLKRPLSEIIEYFLELSDVPDMEILEMIVNNINGVDENGNELDDEDKFSDDVEELEIGSNPHPSIIEFCIKYRDMGFNLSGIYANKDIFDKNRLVEPVEDKNPIKFTETRDILKNSFCGKLPTHSNNSIEFNDIIKIKRSRRGSNVEHTVYETEGENKYIINVSKQSIGNGTYGSTHNGTMNGVQMIIKKIKIPTNEDNNVLSETIIQGHLACEHNKYLEEVGGFMIPEIYFIANINNTGTYLIGMEKLDGSLNDLLRLKIDIDKKSEYVYKCILNLSKTLYTLQQSCSFMHRDLHTGNIMFKGDLNDLDNVKWYIIDFGMSFIDIKQTFHKDTKWTTLSKYILTDERFEGVKLNPSQDLRILLIALLEYYDEYFNSQLNGWITEHLLHTSTYLPDKRLISFHNAYEDVYSIIDINLTPIHILSNSKPVYENNIIPTNKKLSQILSVKKIQSYTENPFTRLFVRERPNINKVLSQRLDQQQEECVIS
jgi:hypothetical protein